MGYRINNGVSDNDGHANSRWKDGYQRDAMSVVKRFTPIDANTIRYEATVNDPKAFTQPMKLTDTFRRNTKVGYEQLEFACVECGHTDLEHYTEAAGAPSKPK